MAKRRVKVESEPIVKTEEPKVRAKSAKTINKKVEKVLSEMIPTEKVDNKKVFTDNSFERHKAFGDVVKRNAIADKVKQGLLKWAFYGIENDNGYQYYLKVKK